MDVSTSLLAPRHIERLTKLHRECFPNGFMSKAGAGLSGTLFEYFLQSPLGVCAVAECDGELAGYVAGSLHRDRFWRNFFSEKIVKILFYSLRGLVFNPKLARLGLGRLAKVPCIPEKKRGGWILTDIPAASLMWLAVGERFRKQGIGNRLVNEFFELVRGKVDAVKLGVQSSNLPAIKCYMKSGWQTAFDDHKNMIMVYYLTK
jgi:ribosomal protein S18 acetylase RimI-like enzyme